MVESRSTVVQRWDAAPWLVNWSAVWVGALAMLTVGLIFGLMGIALGAYQEARIVSWHKFQMWALVLSVCGAFFSSVVGGWTAGKILGDRLAERAMLHAAIPWVLTVPMLLVLASLGAAGYFGVWYHGLAGTPVWVTPTVVADPQAAAIMARNGASGEPMTFTYHRTRAAFVASGPE